MLGKTLVEKRVIGAEQVQHVPILAHDALEEQLRFPAQGLPQVVVEIGKQPCIRSGSGKVAQIQPLLREVIDQRFGTAVSQHPAHLAFEHRRLAQLTLNRRVEQFIVRNAAPDKEREPRRQIQIRQAIHGTRRGIRWILFDTEEKVRAGEDRAKRHFDAGFETARRFALLIELRQHLHFGSGHGTPKRTPRQSGNHLLRAAVFIGWLLRAAGEDAPPAWCVARTGRIERTGDRDRIERRLDTRMTIHVEARQVGLAFGLNQRRRSLEKRCVEHVRSGLDGSSYVKITVHGFVFFDARPEASRRTTARARHPR